MEATTFARDLLDDAGLTRERISEVGVPTLLSYGAKSRCLPTLEGLQATLKSHQTVIHPGVGHFFPVVAPDLVVADVRAFLVSQTGH